MEADETGNLEDDDNLLHRKNNKSFRQVVQNLHHACTWYAGTQMRAADSLVRIQEWLDRKRESPLDEEARNGLESAVEHLRRAIETPGWHEWIRYGLSVPIHVPSLPAEIRTAWSESRTNDTDWIDAGSMRVLVERNTNGTTLESLVDLGETALENKIALADAEDLKADTTLAEKEQKLDESNVTIVSVAAAARAPPKVTSRRGSSSKLKSDGIDSKLAEAERNAQLSAEHHARAHLPKPLQEEIEVKTRSHKINYVIRSIRSSPESDRFVIFGDVLEIGLLTEVLELMDIES